MDLEKQGNLIAQKYRAETPLGAVGLAKLYRGANVLLEKPVLLLLLEPALAVDKQIQERFFDEARYSARVEHRNILATTDFGQDADGTAYVVFENAAGEVLSEAIEREGRLPLDITVAITRQIAEALDAAHSAGLVHGNLFPENVLAAGSSADSISVKVFGFGSPNAVNDPSPGQDVSRFAFLAPEQCAGQEDATAAGDVYSLGAVTYFLLSGSAPYAGETATEVMMKNVEEPPPPLASFGIALPDGVEPVILKALAKDPEARYASATEYADDLNAAATPSGAAAAASASANPNNIWKTAFLVLVGVSALTIAMIWATSIKQTDPTTVQRTDTKSRPVQPINPATGVEEQNLANLPPDPAMANSNTNTAGAEIYPGGDGYNAWANGGAPPPGGPPIGPGGKYMTVPNGQSPFMADSNCIPQPSGILLCTVPITPSPTPKVAATPKASPTAPTTDTTVKPVASPSAKPAAQPKKTPAPAKSPAAKASPEIEEDELD